MAIVLTVLIGLFLFLFSGITNAAERYGAKLCANDSEYHCYKVKRGDSWKKLFPDEDQRDIVKRVNRMNTGLHAGMKIAIPNNLNASLLEHSPLPRQIDAPGEKIIMVSLNDLAFGAYNSDGSLEFWGPISGGKGYCPDTGKRCRSPAGNFAIYSKRGGGCVSSKFPIGRGGAPMPYCMFFHGGFAMHGSYEVPGYNASHGCIRMFVNDAQWLNTEFTAGEHGVPVIIKRS